MGEMADTNPLFRSIYRYRYRYR